MSRADEMAKVSYKTCADQSKLENMCVKKRAGIDIDPSPERSRGNSAQPFSARLENNEQTELLSRNRRGRAQGTCLDALWGSLSFY